MSSIEDADQQQRAFQEYMLGKLPPTTPQREVSTERNSNTPMEKRFFSLLRAFYDSIIEWFDIDDQALQVMSSIENLRRRCLLTSQTLVLLRERPNESSKPSHRIAWRANGFRTEAVEGLSLSMSLEDLEFALSDELLQHEKMMSLARRLLSQLDQQVRAMQRRLDDLLLHRPDYQEESPVIQMSFRGRGDESLAIRLEECRVLFSATARELFRKQLLAQDVFDSACDGLVTSQENNWDLVTDTETDPRGVVRRCVRVWSRKGKDSYFADHQDLIRRVTTHGKE